MKCEPQKEHQWLQELVGDWVGEGEAEMEPGKPPVHWQTREQVRSLGDVWVLFEGSGEMPECGFATTLTTLGYDPQKQHYVGTFVGSMMTSLWIYEGTLDAGGKVLTLETEGPDMAHEGRTTKYRDVLEIKSRDHRILKSFMLGPDREWHGFMTANYRRKI